MKLVIKFDNEMQDKLLSLFICYILAWYSLRLAINDINEYLFHYNLQNILFLFLIIYIIFFVYSLKNIFIPKNFIPFLLLLNFWILSYIFIKKKEFMWTELLDVFANPFYRLFLYGFWGYIVVNAIKRTNYLFIYLKVTSYIIISVSICRYILSRFIGFEIEYMTFSYGFLFFMTFLGINLLKKFNFLDLLFFLPAVYMALVAGARGPIFSLIFAFVVAITVIKERYEKKLFWLFFFSMFAIIILININHIALFLYNYLLKKNIHSRTLFLFVTGDILNSSGRDTIRHNILNDAGLIGKGLYSDRLVGGYYSHNLFVEWIHEFGWILGLLISMFFLIFVLYNILKSNGDYQILLISFLSTGFFKLLLSGSWLGQEPDFYILLGLCVNNVIHKRYFIKNIFWKKG